jgi:hypothetical protein
MLVVTACLRSPGPPLHPELFRAARGTVCVAPPQVSVGREKVMGSEAIIEKSQAIEDSLHKHVSEALARKGYHVSDPLSRKNLSQRQELQDAVADLQKRHDELLPLIYRDRSGATSGRFSLGAETANVGEAAEVDLIAFVRLEGSTPSGGAKALYFVLTFDPFVPKGFTALYVTLVDARSGAILANLSSHFNGDIFKDTERRVAALLERAFSSLPPRGAEAVPPGRGR